MEAEPKLYSLKPESSMSLQMRQFLLPHAKLPEKKILMGKPEAFRVLPKRSVIEPKTAIH